MDIATTIHPDIAGRCPACGSDGTLFLGSGGYVTCSVGDCPNPGAAYDLLAGEETTKPDDPREGFPGMDVDPHELAERAAKARAVLEERIEVLQQENTTLRQALAHLGR